jgi:heme-degrading monooxygenase HmoA
MFARIVTIQFKRDTLDEAIKFYRESTIPAAKSQKGFHSVYLLTDSKTSKGISVALWDSEEDIIANEESGWWQGQIDKFKDFFAVPPIREVYEVSAQS